MTSTDQSPAPSGAQWHIRAAGYEATVVEVGGGLRALRHDGVDIICGFDEDEMADAARGHVLAPWPNRIAQGEYSVGGDGFLVPWNEPALANASHGLVAWMPWQVVEHEEHQLTVGVTLRPQPGWAWTLRLEITYALGPDGLTVTPRATNLSDSPCPFGFGAHPYLTAGETTLDDVTLTLPALTRIDVDERLIPTGRSAADPRLMHGLRLEGVALDTCFTDLDASGDDDAPDSSDDPGAANQARLGTDKDARPGDGDRATPADESLSSGRWAVTVATSDRSTTLWADAAAYPFVQTFTGDGLPEPKRRRSGLAVEPMTCAANAFNSGDGLVMLDPGETWSAPFGIRAVTPARVLGRS